MATLDEIRQAEVENLSIRQRVEAFYKGTDAIRQFAKEVMVPILQGQLSLSDHERAVAGTYFRMYLFIESLVTLNSRMHFQAAASSARSLFELLLDVKLLESDTDGSLTAQFHAFTESERFRVAKNIVTYNDAHSDSGIDDTHQRRLVDTPGKQQSIDRLKVRHWGVTRNGQPHSPEHWSKNKIRTRANKLGATYEELYVESYPLLSWYVHAGSSGYAGLDENTIETIFGLAHSIAQQCFLDATEVTAMIFHINDAVEGFHGILEVLRLTPGMVIAEEQARIIDEARSSASNGSGSIIIP